MTRNPREITRMKEMAVKIVVKVELDEAEGKELTRRMKADGKSADAVLHDIVKADLNREPADAG